MSATFLGNTPSTLTLSKGSKEIAQAIYNVAQEFGAHISFWMGGKHPFAKIEREGKFFKLHFAGSPGDSRRAARNQEADTRRICRRAGWSPIPAEKKEQPVTTLAQTGKGSMFDAQPGSRGPASPVRSVGNEAITVGDPPIAIPFIPDIAKRLAGIKSKGPTAYQAFTKRRNQWAAQVYAANPNNPRIWDDMVAALELGGYKTTVSALQQAVRIIRQKADRPTADVFSKPSADGEKKRINFPRPTIEPDHAKLAAILKSPPHIPEFARREIGAVNMVKGGENPLTSEYRMWAANERYRWIAMALDAGGTDEQILAALRAAGHPIRATAMQLADRRWRKEAWEAGEAARAAEAARVARLAAEKAAKKAAKAPVLTEHPKASVVWNALDESEAEEVEELPRSQPARKAVVAAQEEPEDAISYQGIIRAVRAVVEAEVAKAIGGLDIEALKKKAHKWDTYQKMKALRAELSALGDDD